MDSAPGGLRPGLATALAVVGFGALAICGLGVLSLVSGADVIAVPGLGAVPGAVAFAASALALAVALATSVRGPRPSYGVAALAAVVAPLAYVAGVFGGAILVGVDAARAAAAAGAFALSWFAVVVAVCAAICGWVAVALVRTQARPPRWGWERDDEE